MDENSIDERSRALLDELDSLEPELTPRFGRATAKWAVAQGRYHLSSYRPERGSLLDWVAGIARSKPGLVSRAAEVESQPAHQVEEALHQRLDAGVGLDRLSRQVAQAAAPLSALLQEHPGSVRPVLVALVLSEVSHLVGASARLTNVEPIKAAAVVVDGVARSLSNGLHGSRASDLDRLEELARACEALRIGSRGYVRSRTDALGSVAKHLEALAGSATHAAQAAIRHLIHELPTLPRAGVPDTGRLEDALRRKLESHLLRDPEPQRERANLSHDDWLQRTGDHAMAEKEWRERFGVEALKRGLEVLGADGKQRNELLAGLRKRREREAKREHDFFEAFARDLEADPDLSEAFDRALAMPGAVEES